MTSLAQFAAEVVRGFVASIVVAVDECLYEARKVAESRRH